MHETRWIVYFRIDRETIEETCTSISGLLAFVAVLAENETDFKVCVETMDI